MDARRPVRCFWSWACRLAQYDTAIEQSLLLAKQVRVQRSFPRVAHFYEELAWWGRSRKSVWVRERNTRKPKDMSMGLRAFPVPVAWHVDAPCSFVGILSEAVPLVIALHHRGLQLSLHLGEWCPQDFWDHALP